MLFYEIYLLSLAVIVGFIVLYIIKISGVALLEISFKESKSEYNDNIRRTNTIILWFPKK